jgi:hypothetical protein
LPIHFDDIDAEHLPERHRLRRQWRAGADHQLELVKSQLVEKRQEDAGAAGAIERAFGEAPRAVPAPPRVCARELHGDFRARALDAAGISDAEQHLCGEPLQIARHGEQDRRRGLEQGRR